MPLSKVRSVSRYAGSAFPESGLFAARPIPRGQLAAFYSGLVAPCDIDFFALSARSAAFSMEEEEEEEQEQHGVPISRKNVHPQNFGWTVNLDIKCKQTQAARAELSRKNKLLIPG